MGGGATSRRGAGGHRGARSIGVPGRVVVVGATAALLAWWDGGGAPATAAGAAAAAATTTAPPAPEPAALAAAAEPAAFAPFVTAETDLLLLPAARRPPPRPVVVAATRVLAPASEVSTVFLTPALLRQALPALVRADVMATRPGPRPDAWPDRLLAWEVEVPLFNLTGKAWLHQSTDGAELTLVEGAFAPGRIRFRVAADPRSRDAAILTCEVQVEVRIVQLDLPEGGAPPSLGRDRHGGGDELGGGAGRGVARRSAIGRPAGPSEAAHSRPARRRAGWWVARPTGPGFLARRGGSGRRSPRRRWPAGVGVSGDPGAGRRRGHRRSPGHPGELGGFSGVENGEAPGRAWGE